MLYDSMNRLLTCFISNEKADLIMIVDEGYTLKIFLFLRSDQKRTQARCCNLFRCAAVDRTDE